MDRVGQHVKLHFQQENERMCHVLFVNDPRISALQEGVDYELSGWQKVGNRHNVITIH
jgi:hypothetical protein